MSKDGQIQGKDIIADDVFERLSRLDSSLEALIKRFQSLESRAVAVSTSGGLQTASRQAVDLNIEANAQLKEQKKLEDALIRVKAQKNVISESTGRALAREKIAVQQINLENKRAAIQQSKTLGAYKKLSNELNIQKDRLKDLIITQGEFSAAAQKQGRVVDELNGRIRRADAASGDFQRNVGNYPTAFARASASMKPLVGFFRQMVGAFGLIEAARLGLSFVKDARTVAREAKGVEFAFKNLGDAGVDSFDRIKKSTRGLLSDLEIKKSIVDFDNFRLSTEQLDTVLEFVTIRAAQTGKSFEYLKDSATEAITKESVLRADNLGISQKALNEELSKGASFLEAFANIAKSEIKRAGDILGQAENNAQKFAASLENVKVFAGEIFNTFTQFGVVNDVMSTLTTTMELNLRTMQQGGGVIDFMTNSYRMLTVEGRLQNIALLNEYNQRRKTTEAIREQYQAYIDLNGSLGPLRKGQEEKTKEEDLPIFMQPKKLRLLKDINEELEKYNNQLEEGNFSSRKDAKAIQDRIAKLEKERDAILGVKETRKQLKVELSEPEDYFEENSERAFAELISALEDARSRTEIGSLAWEDYGYQIEAVRKQVESLRKQYEAFNVDDLEFFDGEDMEEIFASIETQVFEDNMARMATTLGQSQADLMAEYKRLYGEDLSHFKDYIQAKIEQEQLLTEMRRENELAALDVVGDFAQAYTDIQNRRIDNELDRQNKAFEAIANSKTASEEQIAIAEKKRAENEERLEKERAKRQRKAFLIQQGIEVAKILIQDAAASAAALAPPPVGLGPVLGAALIPLIKINTGIALASVLAQSIPQFFMGKEARDNYEGPATWGERRREVKVGSDGKVEVSPNRTTPLWVNRDDIIMKSIPDFESAMSNPSSEVFKRVSSTLRQDTEQRTSMMVVNSGASTKGVETAIQRGLQRGFKGVKNQINIINRIDGRVTRY